MEEIAESASSHSPIKGDTHAKSEYLKYALCKQNRQKWILK